jgi:putative CocE/NonD family hydrolase
VQWQAAAQGDVPLTAMAPQAIMGDYFGEYHRIGGAVQWALTALAAVTFASAVALTQRGCAQIFGNQRFYRHLPLITADEALIGRPIPYFRDWLQHSLYNDYWAALDTHRAIANIGVPVCQQGAWYDPYTEAMFRLFNGVREGGATELARASQKIYIVPWTHHAPEGSRLGDLDFGPSAYVDLNQEDLRWFDHWLKGLDTGLMDEPPIKIFVMGANEWRHEHEWPLARTAFTPYYLHSGGRANTLYGDGALSPEPPGAEPADRFSWFCQISVFDGLSIFRSGKRTGGEGCYVARQWGEGPHREP